MSSSIQRTQPNTTLKGDVLGQSNKTKDTQNIVQIAQIAQIAYKQFKALQQKLQSVNSDPNYNRKRIEKVLARGNLEELEREGKLQLFRGNLEGRLLLKIAEDCGMELQLSNSSNLCDTKSNQGKNSAEE